MPQLIPGPWFLIFAFSWLVFLVLLPLKVLPHSLPNKPTTQSTEKFVEAPCKWPWP
uniref:ATP synthase F0 subunit 8 n=1 Tax=Gephyroberyx darwinii TaxID=334984 RepID=UPI0028D160A3|nr:ATP synthase F0 subunit 8 [Gephyroberyx darwinii]WMY89568.1 ATP synthase F0 subunit 8 [Gephyroberyx darwinii]WMY90296.1 ATP synthase F0 subunit 8 [Gephyroberyx darwinii]